MHYAHALQEFFKAGIPLEPIFNTMEIPGCSFIPISQTGQSKPMAGRTEDSGTPKGSALNIYPATLAKISILPFKKVMSILARAKTIKKGPLFNALLVLP
jgi:hypothetical protein